ncbi:MAG: hypothetical protein ACK5Q5_18110, partial [Planctomycetaceae bacterium]
MKRRDDKRIDGCKYSSMTVFWGQAVRRAVMPVLLAVVLAVAGLVDITCAQSVCLPSPHLLTITPMGGQLGTTVEVTISGADLDDVDALRFSNPGLTAVPQVDAAGLPVANKFAVTIAADCPVGLHEARVMTHLGVSSSRMFSVGSQPEITSAAANTSLDKATGLPLNTVCNAYLTKQAVDHYSIEVPARQRIVIDCAARGIDSKANPVLILADAEGNDLQAERRGGIIDYTTTTAGNFIVKLHDLTFNGGQEYFYRLVVHAVSAGASVPRFASTEGVSSFSWPPAGLTSSAVGSEVEPGPNAKAQSISLPCDLAGSFYPAADVDCFEFTAKKGEVWWVEVASERLGRPTDPAVVVQRVTPAGDGEQLTDVVELNDIPTPVKVSSNGYAYDGPPYNAGSADINGMVNIPADGTYRLQTTDLFGGTRSDPNNVYRLIIRQPAPDFAIVGWPLHMMLRNGDRNALSKPIALRGGATQAFEVVVIRRDGFDGEIAMAVENLPTGVTATGLTIGKGKTRGVMLFTAEQDAPRGVQDVKFVGRADIDGREVTRPGRFAEMAWPVKDHWQELPMPRLLRSIPVSVSGHEFATLTLAPADARVWEATAGTTLTIPLTHTRRCDFSGANITLRTFGAGLESNAAFDVSLTAESSEATIDLAKLKTPPGDYTIAFYGSAVAKYRDRPDLQTSAEEELAASKTGAEQAVADAKAAADNAASATEQDKASLQEKSTAAVQRQKQSEAAVTAAEKTLQAAMNRAKPKDIADIIVSQPIHIRVLPVEEAAKP